MVVVGREVYRCKTSTAEHVGQQAVAADGVRWLAEVGQDVLESLRSRGEATAAEITEDVPELGAKLRFGEGKKWGGEVGVSTRVLFLLATEGSIVRARPRGTWLSSQYRWALTDRWLGASLVRMDTETAQAELLRRYLRAFGPATLTDIRWWTGWRVGETRRALEAVDAREVAVGDGSGHLLPDDDEAEAVGEWVALLPSLDPTVMGWKDRTWYLGDHAAALFDRNGNAGPTVWADGRIVGGWGQRESGQIVWRFLEDVDQRVADAVEGEAVRLEAWMEGRRVTPRFRTPLDKVLATA